MKFCAPSYQANQIRLEINFVPDLVSLVSIPILHSTFHLARIL